MGKILSMQKNVGLENAIRYLRSSKTTSLCRLRTDLNVSKISSSIILMILAVYIIMVYIKYYGLIKRYVINFPFLRARIPVVL